MMNEDPALLVEEKDDVATILARVAKRRDTRKWGLLSCGVGDIMVWLEQSKGAHVLVVDQVDQPDYDPVHKLNNKDD